MAKPELPAAVGIAIKQMREFKRLDRKAVLEHSEINPGSLSRIEAGKQRVTWETLEKLCKALKCLPSEIIKMAETEGFDRERQAIVEQVGALDREQVRSLFSLITPSRTKPKRT